MLSGESQPGGRPAAPGDLALVQEFVNTHYDLAGGTGGEGLKTPERLSRWLSDHALIEPGTALSPPQLARALALREGLRSLAFGNIGAPGGEQPPAALDGEAPSAAVRISLGSEGPRLHPMGNDEFERAIAALVAIVARAMLAGSWTRLKACPGHDCGWAFYDRSRNGTGRWCSMSVCGGRAKARSHYQRRHGL